MMSDNQNQAQVRYFQRRVSSVQRGTVVDGNESKGEDILFDMPCASSNASIDFDVGISKLCVDNQGPGNVQNGSRNVVHENNNQLKIPHYQKWAFQNGDD